jgi:hypothetical protein
MIVQDELQGRGTAGGTLPIAWSDDDLIVGPNGEPVWPLRTPEDLAALKTLADRSNLKLVFKDYEPGGREGAVERSARDEATTGAVVALSPELEWAARLYAHLTSAVFAESVDVARSLGQRVVALFAPSEFQGAGSWDAADGISSEGFYPGLFLESDRGSLLRQVLIRSASLRLSARYQQSIVELYPGIQTGARTRPGLVAMGGDTPSASIRTQIVAGSEFLFILTHSDGVDAMLAPELILCPAKHSVNWGADGDPPPYCAETGHCLRYNCGIEEATASERTIAPREIRAKVLVLATCYGALGWKGAIRPSWGYLKPLLESGSVSAVVTCFGVTTPSPKKLRPFLEMLAMGASLGEAIAVANQDQDNVRAGFRLCLFGESRLRPSAEAATLMMGTLLAQSAASASSVVSVMDFGGIAFLNGWLGNAVESATGENKNLALEALAWTRKYEFESAHGGVPDTQGAAGVGGRLRQSLISFIIRRGSVISIDWMRLCSTSAIKSTMQCAGCGDQAPLHTYAFHSPFIPARSVAFCDNCGIIYDGVEQNQFQIRSDGARITVHNLTVKGPWQAALRIGCQQDAESQVIDWPERADGLPADFLDIPPVLPPGALRLSLIIISQATIAIATTVHARECKSVDGRCP